MIRILRVRSVSGNIVSRERWFEQKLFKKKMRHVWGTSRGRNQARSTRSLSLTVKEPPNTCVPSLCVFRKSDHAPSMFTPAFSVTSSKYLGTKNPRWVCIIKCKYNQVGNMTIYIYMPLKMVLVNFFLKNNLPWFRSSKISK